MFLELFRQQVNKPISQAEKWGNLLSTCQSPSLSLESHCPLSILVLDLVLVMRSRAAPGSTGKKLCGVCCVNPREFFSPANALSLGWCTQGIDFSLRKEGFFFLFFSFLWSLHQHTQLQPQPHKQCPELGAAGALSFAPGHGSPWRSWTND